MNEEIADDIHIEDVDPVKKVVPIFTKKGKLAIAVVLVATTIYFLWKRSKEQAVAPAIAPAPVATEAPAPATEAPAPEPIAE
jgi:hypothetical protein